MKIKLKMEQSNNRVNNNYKSPIYLYLNYKTIE